MHARFRAARDAARRGVAMMTDTLQPLEAVFPDVSAAIIARSCYPRLLAAGAGDDVRPRAAPRSRGLVVGSAKFLYHRLITAGHRPPAVEAGDVVLVPLVWARPHLLSILQRGLSDRFPVRVLHAVGNRPLHEVFEVTIGRAERIEAFLSARDIVDLASMLRAAARPIRAIGDRVVQRLRTYGFEQSALGWLESEIRTHFAVALEYGRIGGKLAARRPRAIVTEAGNVGKGGYMLRKAQEAGVRCIGLQHGVVNDAFDYLPASDWFGCCTETALRAIDEVSRIVKERSDLFVYGLPEQLRRVNEGHTHSDEPKAVGIVDGRAVDWAGRRALELLQGAEGWDRFRQVVVKDHPRGRSGERLRDFGFQPSSEVEFLGPTSWGTFTSQVRVAVTASLDAVYELLHRKVPTIAVDPLGEFSQLPWPALPVLKVVRTESELGQALAQAWRGEMGWQDGYERELGKALAGVFGTHDDTAYARSIIEVIDAATEGGR